MSYLSAHLKRVGTVVAAAWLLLAGRACSADAVTDWNGQVVQALKTANVTPGRQPRQLAVVHVAMFDAVNGIARKYTPYLVHKRAPGGARQEAAAIQAAYTTLVALFPDQKARFDTQLAASLEELTAAHAGSASIRKGRAWGEQVARAVIARRSTDGYNNAVPDYFGSDAIGIWRPVPPNEGKPAVFQEIAVMTPFALGFPGQLRPGPPPALTSAEYAADVNEVKRLGSATSTERTPEQTLASRIWAAVDPADENASVRALIPTSTKLVDTARLFALMNMAGADAFIYVMDAKRTYNLWRPFHAIRLADLDNNPLTEADPNWTPLLVTPRHQEYPSGHSVFTSAHMRVVGRLLGDTTGITISSTGFSGSQLTYGSLSDAVNGVQDSRVFGGIHFRTAVVTSGRDGARIADYVVNSFLRPTHRR